MQIFTANKLLFSCHLGTLSLLTFLKFEYWEPIIHYSDCLCSWIWVSDYDIKYWLQWSKTALHKTKNTFWSLLCYTRKCCVTLHMTFFILSPYKHILICTDVQQTFYCSIWTAYFQCMRFSHVDVLCVSSAALKDRF